MVTVRNRRQTSEVVDLGNGRRASYRVIGEGRPTLMLPGGPGLSGLQLESVANLFCDELESYQIDPPGSGLSTPPADLSQYSPSGHAAFYEEVRAALGFDEVVVLGWSFGATTALTYSALFPDAVAACVSLCGLAVAAGAEAGRDPAVDEEWERCLARHAENDWYPEARRILDSWHDQVLATEDPDELEQALLRILPLYTAYPNRADVAAGLAAFTAPKGLFSPNLACLKAWESSMYAAFDLRPILGKIGCPTLVVAGALDFITGPAQATTIAEAVPDARLVIIPDCAHLPQIEAPAVFREAVVSFLTDLKM